MRDSALFSHRENGALSQFFPQRYVSQDAIVIK
jgi:hypothetical protein